MPDRVQAHPDAKRRKAMEKMLTKGKSPFLCDVCFQDVRPPAGALVVGRVFLFLGRLSA